MEILQDKARSRTKARQIESGRSVVRHLESDRSVGPRVARGGTKTRRYFGTTVCRHLPCVVPYVVVNIDPLSSRYTMDERLISTGKRMSHRSCHCESKLDIGVQFIMCRRDF